MTSSYGSAYYAAPKKRPPVFLIVLGLLLAAGVAAIVYTETTTVEAEPPTETAEPEAAAQAAELVPEAQGIDDRQELLAENARLRAEVERLQGLLAGAEVDAAELADLNQEVLQLREELERYRTGLKNAVGELNAQRRAPDPPPHAAPQRSSKAASSADLGRWVQAYSPSAVMNVNSADVSGSVHNANDQPVSGYVVLTVLANGREVGSDQVRMHIPATSVEEYSTSIGGRFPAGPSYEVTASWEME